MNLEQELIEQLKELNLTKKVIEMKFNQRKLKKFLKTPSDLQADIDYLDIIIIVVLLIIVSLIILGIFCIIMSI